MAATPTLGYDHRAHLADERQRLVEVLACLVAQQRHRGRSPAGDALGGLVIEDGEAEGLIAALRQPPPFAAAAGAGGGAAGRDGDRPAIDRRAEEAAAAGARLPLRHLRRAFNLRDAEYDALLLALLVEIDGRAGRLVAYLNDQVERSRPTVGLAQSVAEAQGLAADPLDWYRRPMLADGLLELSGDGPLPGRALSLDVPQARRIVTLDDTPAAGVQAHPPDPGLLDRLVLPPTVRERVAGWAARAAVGAAPPVVVVAGAPGVGRSALIRAAAGVLGRPLVSPSQPLSQSALTLRLLRREARWYGADIAVHLPDREDPAAAGAAADQEGPATWWRHLGRPPGRVFLECAPQLLPDLLAAAPAEPEVWTLEVPSLSDRAALWQRLLPAGMTLPAGDADALAAGFRFGPAAIARAVRRADAERGEAALTRARLATAARGQVGGALAGLAERLPLPYTRADLVVGPETGRELDLACAWVRHRTQVLDRWGLGARVADGRGLTVLFTGPPGTGKTMAAQVLARELELDCFRIDLSRVVSKFIGETEKHLARLFDDADAGGAVLLFDEADTLFGKRSEVSDAHDRYANMEVGYLLQRMERFDGVAVLASNRAADLDEAFVRRFQVIARFRLPVAAERRRIWAGLIPDECDRDAGLDGGLEQVGEAFELSGGEIKNCVLAAAYLAAAEQRPLALRHVLAAIRRELAKSGRLVDEALFTRIQA